MSETLLRAAGEVVRLRDRYLDFTAQSPDTEMDAAISALDLASQCDPEIPEEERADALARARDQHEREGECEIDGNAELSRSDDGGYYVQAWLWVPDED